jgi:hypothetical protein
MDLLRSNEEYTATLLDPPLEAKVKECQQGLGKLFKELKLLETWEAKLSSGKASEQIQKQIPEKLALIKSLFEEGEERMRELAELKTEDQPKEKKKKAECLNTIKDQIHKTHTRYQELTKKLLMGLKKQATTQRQPQHRMSGDVMVYEMHEMEADQQAMAQYGDAAHLGEVIAERQQDINHIEALMNNVADVAKQIATVVEGQDELVDQIGVNARQTRANAKAAVKELAEGNEARGSANNKMLFLLFCIIVVILFIAVLLSV